MLLFTRVLALCLLALGPGACRARPDAARPRSELVLAELMGGVVVSAQADAWTGDAVARQHATVLRVTVHNDGERPLRLYLDDMRLLVDGGRAHAALPLYVVEHGVVQRHAHRPFPRLGHDGFRVAAPYGPYYPGLPIHHSRRLSEPGGYDYADHFAYWDAAPPLPTPCMVDLAIPEGVLGPHGYVSGFVFFERVAPPPGAEVTFVLDLVDADSGERLGEVELPVDVRGS